MKRRVIAALAAVLSAALGAGLLLTYVSGADRRAMAGMQPVQVMVVTEDVPVGTTGTALENLVVAKTLPVAALAPGAVRDLSTLAGLVSTSELKQGEQVLLSRFADPATLADAGRPRAPRGTQQLSIDVEPQRVVGGDLAPGAKVAGFTTIEKRTSRVIRSALVLRVEAPVAANGDAPPGAPTDGHVRLTLALTPSEATQLVAGANRGAVWFTLVSAAPPADPSTSPTTSAVPQKGVSS